MRKILSTLCRLRGAVAVLLIVFTVAFFSLTAVAQGRATAQSQAVTSGAKRALVISLDGLDARYLADPDKYHLRIPTLRRLMSEGATASGVVSVYPTVTYPNHTTMVTGAYPSRHGIFGNDMFIVPDGKQPRAGNWFARDIRAETLWDAAQRKGLKVGMVWWPVAGGAGDYNVPEIWQPGGTSEESRAVMARHARPSGIVEEVERRSPDIYRNVNKDEGDDMRTSFAEYILREKRPDLMFVHLFDLDHFQHDFGPFTPEALAMLEKTDGYVARLLAAAESAGTLNETAVLITSDHGFMPITKQIHPGVLLAQAGLVNVREEKDAQGRVRATATDWRALPYVTGGACAIYLRDERDRAALDKVRELFAAKGRGAEGVLRVMSKDEVRKLNSNTRAAVMLEAADGYTFGSNLVGDYVTDSGSRGMHGYLPTRPGYRASLVISGAGVTRRGSLGEARMIDIGPTIARLLELKLRDAEGRALQVR